MQTLYFVGAIGLCIGLVYREIQGLKAKLQTLRHIHALKSEQRHLQQELARQARDLRVLRTVLLESRALSEHALADAYVRLAQSSRGAGVAADDGLAGIQRLEPAEGAAKELH